METTELVVEDLTIEELDDVTAADTCFGTASCVGTPISSAACVGSASL